MLLSSSIISYLFDLQFGVCTHVHVREYTHIMRKEIRILTQLHSCLPVLVLNVKHAPQATCANYLTIDKLCNSPIQCVYILHVPQNQHESEGLRKEGCVYCKFLCYSGERKR
jgi:hypothetical protein